MTPAAPVTPVAVPADPVRAALADEHVLADLRGHARALVGRQLKVRSMIDREDAAEAIMQETARRALEKCEEYDPARSVTAWLHGILNYVLFEISREFRDRPAQLPDRLEAWDRLAMTFVEIRSNPVDQRLDAAFILAHLADEQRTILEWRYAERLEHAEIAARLGISPGNARVKLCRALAAARAVVGVEPGEDAR